MFCWTVAKKKATKKKVVMKKKATHKKIVKKQVVSKKKKKTRKWTEEENNFLKENYKKLGSKLCGEKLNRTQGAVMKQSQKLKITTNKKWTKKEHDFLIKNFNSKGMKFCVDNLIGRTEITISIQVGFLKLRKSKKWTKKEDNFLIKNYHKGKRFCSENLPGRTIPAIDNQAAKLNLRKKIEKSKKWSDDDVTFLKNEYLKLGIKKCAKKLNRTPINVRNKALKMGLKLGVHKGNVETFIEKSNLIHNYKFDYSKSIYNGSNSNIDIICLEHGLFSQKVNVHLNSGGCPKCVKHKNYNTEIVLKLFKEKHGEEKYDYSLFSYEKSNKKVSVICTESGHGTFSITPNSHLVGRGCPKCSKNYRYTQKEIIERFKVVHGNLYDYQFVDYKNANSKITIVCSKHGRFSQAAHSHAQGSGCQICSSETKSKGEDNIYKILLNNKVDFIKQHKFDNCKHKNKLSFDFYLPKLNTCIEYNGGQHYWAVNFFGGEKSFKEQQIKDQIKIDYCKDNNIQLVIIRYDEEIETKLREYKIIP